MADAVSAGASVSTSATRSPSTTITRSLTTSDRSTSTSRPGPDQHAFVAHGHIGPSISVRPGP